MECTASRLCLASALLAAHWLAVQVSKVDPSTPEPEAKRLILEKLKRFMEEKIVFANREVVANAATKVEDGDVILTYAYSSVIFNLLLHAHRVGIQLDKPCIQHRSGPKALALELWQRLS